jgi:glycosyltransferase involved in cell wall biosynthesis
MAKIGIYNEPFSGGLGGSEYTAAVIAEILGTSHTVELMHHRPSLTTEELEEFSGTALSAVHLRYVAPADYTFGSSRNPWRRYRDARKWHDSLSAPYDLFIALVHNVPPFCHAPKGLLIVLFPRYCPPHKKRRENVITQTKSVLEIFSARYQRWEWEKRLESYQVKTAISQRTRAWVQQLWGTDCRVLYPPVDAPLLRPDSKGNIILSAGRFAIEGEWNGEEQLEILDCFRTLHDADLNSWQYFYVGDLDDSNEHRAYFDLMHRAGAECHVEVLANLKRDQVQSLFERASIFWHAAGHNQNEEAHPELVEEFGLATIQAMAAGCVPVVINKGIQGEIVEHGVSGYLWESTKHLREYTLLLAQDESLRRRMSAAARKRAQLFSYEAFQEKFLGLLGPLPS